MREGSGARRQTWLTRNLIVLSIVSMTQDMASEMLYPLLPVFLIGVLAAPPVVLGVTEGLADATAGVSRWVAGRWSDRRGRKPFIAVGYGLAALGKLLVAAAGAWPVVLVGRVVDRFGKGVRSAPRDALIAASVPPEVRGRAFGFHRAADTLGAVIGPLLGLGVLAAASHRVRAALWWAVLPALASVLVVALVRDDRARSIPGRTTPAPTAHPDPVSATAPDPFSRTFRMVTGLLVGFAVINFSDALLLLRLSQLGMSATEVIAAYIVFNIVYTVLSYPAGALADRLHPGIIYAAGLCAFGAAYLGLGVIRGPHAAYALMAVYGIFPALTDGVGKAWISRLAPAGQAGRAQGLFQGLTAGAVLGAGLWAGLAWSRGAGRGTLPLLISGVAGLVSATAMALLTRTGALGAPAAPRHSTGE